MKVFIVHTRRTAYGVIRSLCHKDFEIYGADTFRSEAAYSKYLKNFFIIPDITTQSDEAYCRLMVSLAERMNYKKERPVVFTGKDDYLLFFSRNYDKLQEYFQLSFESDSHKLELALDKVNLARIAEESSVSIPKSCYQYDGSNHHFALKFPVVIKPAIKNRPDIDVVSRAFRIKYCENVADLEDAVRQLEKVGQPYIIQEYIPGTDESLYTIGTYSYKGRLKAWSTGFKVRQFPPSVGECSLGKTEYVPELIEPASRLLSAIGLTGISQIEFKRYKGIYYLIEINPRIWSWHEIHRKVGVNFPLICMDQLAHKLGDDVFIQPNDIEIYWQFVLMDLLHNNLLNKNVSKWKIVGDLLKSHVEAFFNIKDPRPFLIHFVRTIKYINNELKSQRKISLKQ